MGCQTSQLAKQAGTIVASATASVPARGRRPEGDAPEEPGTEESDAEESDAEEGEELPFDTFATLAR
jgi:hypothetical protein